MMYNNNYPQIQCPYKSLPGDKFHWYLLQPQVSGGSGGRYVTAGGGAYYGGGAAGAGAGGGGGIGWRLWGSFFPGWSFDRPIWGDVSQKVRNETNGMCFFFFFGGGALRHTQVPSLDVVGAVEAHDKDVDDMPRLSRVGGCAWWNELQKKRIPRKEMTPTKTIMSRHVTLKISKVGRLLSFLLTWIPSFVFLNQGSTLFHMGVSVNSGTPKSSILIGFSIINHPFWGTLLEIPIWAIPKFCQWTTNHQPDSWTVGIPLHSLVAGNWLFGILAPFRERRFSKKKGGEIFLGKLSPQKNKRPMCVTFLMSKDLWLWLVTSCIRYVSKQVCVRPEVKRSRLNPELRTVLSEVRRG